MSLNFGQQLFPPRKENILFDFADVARQTGYLTYYPATANGGALVVQTDPNYRSGLVETQDASSPLNKTIDLKFLTSINLKGFAFFNIPIGIETDVMNTAHSFTATIDIFHYDGSTETQIDTQKTSHTYSYDNDAIGGRGDANQVASFRVNISSVKHFKAGESLRVKIGLTWTGNATGAIGHDPANRISKDANIGTLPVFQTGETKQTWLLPIPLDL